MSLGEKVFLSAEIGNQSGLLPTCHDSLGETEAK